MTTQGLGHFDDAYNKRLSEIAARIVKPSTRGLYKASLPATTELRETLSRLIEVNPLREAIGKALQTSTPQLGQITVKMPRMNSFDGFSTRYGQLIRESTNTGRRFNLKTVQSLVQSVEDGSIEVDEDLALSQDPGISAAIDEEWRALVGEANSTLSDDQRLVLRRTLIVLYLTMLSCVIYVASGYLLGDTPEWGKWSAAFLGAYGLKGDVDRAISWADTDYPSDSDDIDVNE